MHNLEKVLSVITWGYFVLRSRKEPCRKKYAVAKRHEKGMSWFLKVTDTIPLLKNERNSFHSYLRK